MEGAGETMQSAAIDMKISTSTGHVRTVMLQNISYMLTVMTHRRSYASLLFQQ